MNEDASLSEFLSTGEDDERDVDGEEEAGGVTDDPATNVDPESAVSTYAWGEYTCDRCGERTERAWRDEEALVCPACKPW